MRLFLSSENLGKYPDLFVEMTGPSKSVLYVGNAKDYYNLEDRAAKIAEHKAQFEGLGLKFTELDLRNYFEKPIPNSVYDGHGMVWCSGGNTFLLRTACAQSGFDEMLINAVKNEKVAYGGSSAGTILAGPTLHGTEHGDDPTLVDSIYGSHVVWDGLGLVDFVGIPHYGSDYFSEESKKMEIELSSIKVKYIALRDGQVYVVDGSKKELLK